MRRVEVDKSLPPVALAARIVSELLGHARETLPEECCGLVVGADGERYRRSVRCRNDMTKHSRNNRDEFPRDGKTAYWMNEMDYMNAHAEAGKVGERVTAVYHSHVGEPAYLSEMDLDYASHSLFPFPDADQIVVAVPDPGSRSVTLSLDHDGCARDLGIFVWDAGAAAFRGRRVRPAAT